MLNQNWFNDEKFVMFCDYAEYQLFYDTETKSIYEVSETIMDTADTTIKEYDPENPKYLQLYRAYESFVNSSNKTFTGIYPVTFAAQVDVIVEANSPKEAREKAKRMVGEYDESANFHHTSLSDIMNITDKSGNEV